MKKCLEILSIILATFAKILLIYGIIKCFFTFIDFISEKVGMNASIALGLGIIAMAVSILIKEIKDDL